MGAAASWTRSAPPTLRVSFTAIVCSPTPPLSPSPLDLPPEPAPASSTESYLSINDLRASGSFNVPDMHIDLHVYSNEPAERFVFINMNQYRENATTEEGPRVREITTEGVILEYQGSTFLLPRE